MNRIVTILATAILTARLGRIDFQGHQETWYDLNMSKVVSNAHDHGIDGEYWINDDGLKMLGNYVMCAGHPSRYGELVETSRGIGIIVDTGDFAKERPNDIDVATAWGK